MGQEYTSLKGKRVLVTGASGFIGSHLVQRLVAEGAEVYALALNPHNFYSASKACAYLFVNLFRGWIVWPTPI